MVIINTIIDWWVLPYRIIIFLFAFTFKIVLTIILARCSRRFLCNVYLPINWSNWALNSYIFRWQTSFVRNGFCGRSRAEIFIWLISWFLFDWLHLCLICSNILLNLLRLSNWLPNRFTFKFLIRICIWLSHNRLSFALKFVFWLN